LQTEVEKVPNLRPGARPGNRKSSNFREPRQSQPITGRSPRPRRSFCCCTRRKERASQVQPSSSGALHWNIPAEPRKACVCAGV